MESRYTSGRNLSKFDDYMPREPVRNDFRSDNKRQEYMLEDSRNYAKTNRLLDSTYPNPYGQITEVGYGRPLEMKNHQSHMYRSNLNPAGENNHGQ